MSGFMWRCPRVTRSPRKQVKNFYKLIRFLKVALFLSNRREIKQGQGLISSNKEQTFFLIVLPAKVMP